MTALEREWDERLKPMGLGMDAGLDNNRLVYGHEVRKLDFDGVRTWPQEPEPEN